MDYSKFLSRDVGNFFRSPVREIFKRVDLNEIYSFAGGYPSADTFPYEDIKEIATEVIDKYGSKALQYGATQGVTELRQAISDRYGVPVANIQITSSSQQGIDVCTRVFADPGDVILTSQPTYLGALQSFRSYRADVVGVAHENGDEAFRDAYETAIESCIKSGRKVKFLYMVPDFQNPSGETLTLSQRHILVDIARKYDFLIVEDSPYKELRYEGEHLPSLYSMAPERVLQLGSFSKIFAPGFRLGWIFADEALLDSIYVCKQSLDLCPPIMDQYIAAEYLSSGRLDVNLQKNKALYKHKRDLMLSLLERYMPEGVTWTHPEGGLFLFLTLPEGFDAVRFYDKALDNEVAYVAGTFFRTDGQGLNTMRMNFSFIPESKMEEGISRLAFLLTEEINVINC